MSDFYANPTTAARELTFTSIAFIYKNLCSALERAKALANLPPITRGNGADRQLSSFTLVLPEANVDGKFHCFS